jgi:hypothetical protein
LKNKDITPPAVPCAPGTSSVSLREGHTLRVFNNGYWDEYVDIRQRKLHDEELQKVNPAANIIRAMKSKGSSKHGPTVKKQNIYFANAKDVDN